MADADGARLGALGCRPRVVRMGYLSKEGGNTLSRAFPSRRLFILLDFGRLEYYEERCVKVGEEDLASAVEINDWNLVVYVQPHLLDAMGKLDLAIGDILISCNGVALESGADLRSSLAAHATTGHTLTLLRPKGEISMRDGLVERVGELRLRITVADPELTASRPPYVLICPEQRCCDEWLEALQRARGTRDDKEPPLESQLTQSESTRSTLDGDVPDCIK